MISGDDSVTNGYAMLSVFDAKLDDKSKLYIKIKNASFRFKKMMDLVAF